MRYLALQLAYDGTDFSGWQRQSSGTTVQALLETALGQMTHEEVRCFGASRTDAGVHALGQVVHFQTARTIAADGFLHGLRGLLPSTIVVRAVSEVSAQFDARRHAQEKRYRYLIHEAPSPVPQVSRVSLWRRVPLQMAAMRHGAKYLVGRHDFRSFCASNDRSRSKVRTLHRCTIRRVAWDTAWPCYGCGTGHMLIIECIGDGFLKQMVRNIVGTLMHVGEGKIVPTAVRAILRAKDRRQAGPCAPAHGLTLVEITYTPPPFPSP